MTLLKMRKVLPLISLIFVVGCASVEFPAYIQDKHPYTQRFYGEHKEVLEAVTNSLKDFGWQIEGTADPVVYEQARAAEPGSENILLFSQVRQSPRILWTTYSRLNVFISSKNKVSDVEIRYTKIKPLPIKQFKGFRNDNLSKEIFQHITDYLNQS